ncbi:MAG TPA: Fis family transcriptional regulator, partial [Anaeromyxobacteraceae bacterium]|nr:Fis family transcriptional regulator [Anaeromyxobacteraceae bacterium]
MTDLDAETVERVARWCAEAGRQTTAAEIRSALGALGWDELLAAKALLADPPPARPLGPYALADLARGVPADLAAERERSDRYPRGPGPGPSPAPSPEPAAP